MKVVELSPSLIKYIIVKVTTGKINNCKWNASLM